MKGLVTAAISSENTYSASVELKGQFNLSLSGVWTAPVTVQRSYDSGTNWMDVETFASNTEMVGMETQANILYRVGVKLGEYTTGLVEARLSQ